MTLNYNLKLHLLEEIESWESFDLHAVGNHFVLGGVHLGNGAGRVLSGENFGGCLIFGSQLLAVSAR